MMTLHGYLVFFHVLGAVSLFAVLGIEMTVLGRLLRSEAPAEARTWMGALGPPIRLAGPATLLTVASGLWLMKWWGYHAWMGAALLLVVAIGALGGSVTARGMKRLGRRLGDETGETLSGEFRSLQGDPALSRSLRLRIALGIGILGLMTMKPAAGGSVVMVGLAVLAAAVAAARVRPAVTAATPAVDDREAAGLAVVERNDAAWR